MLMRAVEERQIAKDNLWDMVAVLFAMPGQLCIYFLAMLLVARGWFEV